MGANDDARRINVTEAAHFSAQARVNQELLVSSGMVVRMNCYEPGQITPMHMHPDEEEVMYVVEGHGHVGFRDRPDLPMRAGDLLCLPADQFHQLVAADDSRMVLIYFMKPGYGSVRPQDAEQYAGIDRLHGERS